MRYLDSAGLGHLWTKTKAKLTSKQDRLMGVPGQVVGFDAGGQEVVQQGWSNPNLLDNWYFADPVNQRGRTRYTGAGYTIDRWILNQGTAIFAGGVKLDRDVVLLQPIGCADILDGRQYFVSYMDVRGRVFGGPLTVCYAQYGNFKFCNAGRNVLYIRSVDCSDMILAAKLELGRSQTLAHQDEDGTWVLNDPPPDKALELAKCQRYYQIFTDKALRPTRAADFRPPMRVDPALGTIDIGGTTYYTADANL